MNAFRTEGTHQMTVRFAFIPRCFTVVFAYSCLPRAALGREGASGVCGGERGRGNSIARRVEGTLGCACTSSSVVLVAL